MRLPYQNRRDGDRGYRVGRLVLQVVSGPGTRGVVGGFRFGRGIGESPSTRLRADGRLVWFRCGVDLDASGGQHTTVVGPAGSRPVVVDRAAVVAQHRTTAILVVAHHEVTIGKAGCRKKQRRGDVPQRVGLVGVDVYEL